MTVINANVDDGLIKKFRHVIYSNHGLKKGDFKNALEEAMLDYVRKYSQEGSDVGRLAETAQTIGDGDGDLEAVYAELAKLSVDVSKIKNLNPTEDQVRSLLEGLKKLKE